MMHQDSLDKLYLTIGYPSFIPFCNCMIFKYLVTALLITLASADLLLVESSSKLRYLGEIAVAEQ